VAGEADAVTIVESYGRRLAEGIAPVLLALDPALAVMGISQFPTPETAAAADILLTAARRHAQTLLVDPPHWQLSAFGDDGVLTSAVRFALSSVEVVLRPADKPRLAYDRKVHRCDTRTGSCRRPWSCRAIPDTTERVRDDRWTAHAWRCRLCGADIRSPLG
jgi:predicted NBD/HSP70 family sugar kinase